MKKIQFDDKNKIIKTDKVLSSKELKDIKQMWYKRYCGNTGFGRIADSIEPKNDQLNKILATILITMVITASLFAIGYGMYNKYFIPKTNWSNQQQGGNHANSNRNGQTY